MKSLEYLDKIKNDYLLNDDDLSDIIEQLAYIARDNNQDDDFLLSLIDEIEK